MREKASASLERLREMLPTTKRVTANKIDEATWARVPDDGLRRGLPAYVELLEWIEANAKGRYARTVDAFWFELKKDAFTYSLRWKKND